MSVTEIMKLKTLSIKMVYNNGFYRRLEESKFNYEIDSYDCPKITWFYPNGLAVAFSNNSEVYTATFDSKYDVDRIMLFKSLEREYKFNGLELEL